MATIAAGLFRALFMSTIILSVIVQLIIFDLHPFAATLIVASLQLVNTALLPFVKLCVSRRGLRLVAYLIGACLFFLHEAAVLAVCKGGPLRESSLIYKVGMSVLCGLPLHLGEALLTITKYDFYEYALPEPLVTTAKIYSKVSDHLIFFMLSTSLGLVVISFEKLNAITYCVQLLTGAAGLGLALMVVLQVIDCTFKNKINRKSRAYTNHSTADRLHYSGEFESQDMT